MSCNGCRVLRKGCSDTCILRPCLQWIESAESQGHATIFVAKFFGRAGLMSFISAVPESQRPALFQSLLFEACGRTVSPVNGSVGLLGSGSWQVCQAAVETVLQGGKLQPLPDFSRYSPDSDETSDVAFQPNSQMLKRKQRSDVSNNYADLNLSLRISSSIESEESGTTTTTTTTGSHGNERRRRVEGGEGRSREFKLLDLFC
ncbi:unnamed protein product [Rhodiola kirilowii]